MHLIFFPDCLHRLVVQRHYIYMYLITVMWIRIDRIRRIRIRIRIRIQVIKITKFSKHLLIYKSKKIGMS